MVSLLDRLKELPPRHRYGPLGLTLSIALSAWAAVERDLFDGLILLTAVVGLGLGITSRFFPPRPRFQVSFRGAPDPQVLSLVPGWRRRPLDQAAIAQQQVDLAMATMPKRPKSTVPPDMQIGYLIAQGALSSLQAEITGTTEEDLQEFENKVAAYGGIVTDWVGRLEASREEHLKVFKGRLRVEELSSAPADHVRLRLRFPEGFKLASNLPTVEEAPTRPKFNRSVFESMRDVVEAQHSSGSIPWPVGDDGEPTYSIENGKPVVECDLGRINQGDHRDAPTFELRIPGPGSYTVQWEVSSSGLGEPATGTLTIKCQEAKEGAPITKLDEAEAQRKRLEQI